MLPSRLTNREEPDLPRRTFLHAGVAALAMGGAGVLARPDRARANTPEDDSRAEWRNRTSEMAYRRLGRTGMMVSEAVCGGDPITLDNYKHLERAIEMGLNYLDMAPAYNKGDTERAYGKLLAATPGLRQKVFLATKVNGYNQLREGLYKEIFDGLPANKQDAIRTRAKQLREERGVEKP